MWLNEALSPLGGLYPLCPLPGEEEVNSGRRCDTVTCWLSCVRPVFQSGSPQIPGSQTYILELQTSCFAAGTQLPLGQHVVAACDNSPPSSPTPAKKHRASHQEVGGTTHVNDGTPHGQWLMSVLQVMYQGSKFICSPL